MGDQFNEKDLRSYLPALSSQQESLSNLGLEVRIYTDETQTGTEISGAQHDIAEPTAALVSLFL